MDEKKKGIIFYLNQCPALCLLLGATAFWFVLGYGLGSLLDVICGGGLDVWDIAALFALVPGFCGGVLLLMQRPPA